MGNSISNTNKDCVFESDHINKISGIQDIRIIHCKGKKVYLVGENHTRRGSCKPCRAGNFLNTQKLDCIFVNDYLKIITETFHKKGKTFDMFLEHDYTYKTSKSKVTAHGFVVDASNDATPTSPGRYYEDYEVGRTRLRRRDPSSMYPHGPPSPREKNIHGMRAYVQNFRVNHPQSTVRFHYVDVRDFLGGVSEFSPNYITDDERNKGPMNYLLNEVVGVMGGKKRYRRDFVDMLEEMNVNPLLNFISKSGLRHGNIVHKQAIKSSLTPDEIAKLQDTFHDLFDSYLKQKKNYLEYNVKEIVQYSNARDEELGLEPTKYKYMAKWETWLERGWAQNGKPVAEDETDAKKLNKYMVTPLADTIKNLWVYIHDLYTVFRMLKPYTSCCLFYGGSAHTESISKMLKLLGGKVEKFIEAPRFSSCVTLSTESDPLSAESLGAADKVAELLPG